MYVVTLKWYGLIPDSSCVLMCQHSTVFRTSSIVSALIHDSSSVLMRYLSTGFVPVVLGYSCLVID